MSDKREERLANSRTEERVSPSCMKKLKLLMCMDYIVNHIRNYDDYDFRHSWNTMGIPPGLMGVVNTVDEGELVRRKINGIEDDEFFEDAFRFGVQSLVHAVYPKEWESVGPYLHPRKGIFSL